MIDEKNDLKEIERLSHNRKYFEVGCKCIKDKKIKLQGSDVSVFDAVKYYEENCTCSRNYIEKE